MVLMDMNLMGIEAPPGMLIVANSGIAAFDQVLEFFAAQISNDNTRTAYHQAVRNFFVWLEGYDVTSLEQIRPMHVAAWVEDLKTAYSVPSVKLKLTAVTMLLDWLVVKHVLPVNPAKSVRSPRYSIAKGKTPVLSAAEARTLMESIPDSDLIGVRDRALIGLMLYTFVRVGAALAMKRSDVFFSQHRMWVRLFEKGGKVHEMPCHHELEELLRLYLEVSSGPGNDAYLFRSLSRSGRAFTAKRLLPANAHDRVQRRAKAAGIEAHISCHSFRATGITTYLSNSGTLELAARMANHSSTRTTQLYDRRHDAIAQTEVERIRYE